MNRKTEYKYEIGDIVKTKHGEIIIKDKTMKHSGKIKVKAYLYVCNICGNTDIITESNLKANKGCNVCCPNPTKVSVYINSIYARDMDMASLFADIEEAKKYTVCSGKKVKMKCNQCGHVGDYKISTVKTYGFSCKKCSDGLSIGEKFINNIIDYSELEYVFHCSKFDWCKNVKHENYKISGNKEYDFYIPSLNAIIEVHGLQHYEDKFSTIGTNARNLIEENENDKIKMELALKNGIDKYIVIDCRYSNFLYILNKIKEIDFMGLLGIEIDDVYLEELYKKSLKSEMVKICKLYSEGNSVTQISDMTNNKKDTIRKWLNKGNEMGLCVFDGTFNSNNGNSKNIFNTLTKKEYNSISEASRMTSINRNRLSNMVNDVNNKEWVYVN